MTSARWITEADVVSLLSLEEALVPLEAGLARLADGSSFTIPKAMHAWTGGSLHALGAYDAVEGLACFKTWVNTTNGAVAILQLYDADAGTLRAVIEAGALGAMRTSGVTGLATRELAESSADEVAILGSGRQALAQLGAIALVRSISSVRFWSPNSEKREAAADAARQRFGLHCVASATVEDAVRDVPIIASVTRAHDPFLTQSMLTEGAHLNAVGAILPGFAEVEAEALVQASIIAADNPDGILKLREMKEAVDLDPSIIERTTSLSQLLADGAGRPAGSKLTVFKSIGIGASDLALASEVLRRAEAQNVGNVIDHPKPAAPRWRA